MMWAGRGKRCCWRVEEGVSWEGFDILLLGLEMGDVTSGFRLYRITLTRQIYHTECVAPQA